MSDSPHEYVEQLRAQNKILRANVVQLVKEKQDLELTVALQGMEILNLKRRCGLAPHDFEPARPGLSEVD